MSKSKIIAETGEPFPLPEAKPAEPVWVVLLADYLDVPAGRCVRVSASEADALIAEGSAHIANEINLSIGASLARDLTKE